MKSIDLTGQKFGRLRVIQRVGSNRQGVLWFCECECGNQIIVPCTYLRRDPGTKSCGCWRADCIRKRSTTHGLLTSGSSRRLYAIWANMKYRCLNANYRCFHNYGGRGISVCREWLEFKPFYKWAMANGYTDDLTIDRIDNNGNYEPGNCRWATAIDQAQNRRRNHLISFNGSTKTLSQWAAHIGTTSNVLSHRFNRGWSTRKAITTLPRRHRCTTQ